MAKPEDEREFDETTVIGGQQAWSATDRPQQPEPPIAGEPPSDAFTGDPSGPGSADDGDRTVVIEGSWSAPDPSSEPDPAAVPDPSVAPVPPSGPVSPPPSATGKSDPAKPGRHGKSELDKKRPELPAKPRRSERKKKDPVIPPGPVLVAEGLGLLTPAGWVFRDISLTLRPSSVVGIVGPAGTGRSSLLLALTGRMQANTGTLTVAGHSAADKPSAIRALTAVARIGTVIVPEPALTVRQSIDERCLLDDVDPRIGRVRFDEACAAMRLKFEPSALTGSMVGDQATLFSVALACVAGQRRDRPGRPGPGRVDRGPADDDRRPGPAGQDRADHHPDHHRPHPGDGLRCRPGPDASGRCRDVAPGGSRPRRRGPPARPGRRQPSATGPRAAGLWCAGRRSVRQVEAGLCRRSRRR